jgi:hypothetical protein
VHKYFIASGKQKNQEQIGSSRIVCSFRSFVQQGLAGDDIRRNPKPQIREQFMKRTVLSLLLAGSMIPAQAALSNTA